MTVVARDVDGRGNVLLIPANPTGCEANDGGEHACCWFYASADFGSVPKRIWPREGICQACGREDVDPGQAPAEVHVPPSELGEEWP